MFASKVTLLCLALVAVQITDASRTKTTRARLHQTSAGEPKGPHKCTITWPGRQGSTPATVSFGVSSCMIKCKPTNADHHYNKMFSIGFKAVDVKKSCSCQTTAGRELFKIPGSCGDPAEANDRCFEVYKVLTTDEYKSEFNKETLKIYHHHELYHERTFDYTTCVANGCEGESCTEHNMPSVWENRNEAEQKMLAKLIAKAAQGGTKDLTRQQKDLLQQLGKEDVAQAAHLAAVDAPVTVVDKLQALEQRANNDDDVLVDTPIKSTPSSVDETSGIYDDLAERSSNEDGTFTVLELKEHYTYLLRDTGISVDHMADVAGLTDDEHHVTRDEYEKFLKPAC